MNPAALNIWKFCNIYMSKFKGQIKPYPSIVVDKFTGSFQHGFITHEHSDHLSGLHKFSAKPQTYPDTKFYATRITKGILKTQEKYRKLKINILKMNKTVKLDLNGGCINVTPLPANHISGSAMFLFEGDKGNVLHTGDFRINLDQLKDTPLFRDTVHLREVLPIDYLYIDTTFWRRDAYKLPPAADSKELIIRKALDWLIPSDEHVVYLLLRYFGYVNILLELSERAQMKINVDGSRVAMKFRAIPNLAAILTNDTDARIFVKDKPFGLDKGKKLQAMYSLNTRIIKVSTLHFINIYNSSLEYEVKDKHNLFWINHSLHCSQAELKDFVSKLKPKEVIPTLKADEDPFHYNNWRVIIAMFCVWGIIIVVLRLPV